MSSSTRILTGLLVLVALVLGFTVLWTWDSSVGLETTTNVDGEEAGRTAGARITRYPASDGRQLVAEDPLRTVRILVVDESGNPVSDAMAQVARPDSGNLTSLPNSVFSGLVACSSSADGYIDLNGDALTELFPGLARVYIAHPGYCIAEVELNPSLSHYRVALTRGLAQRVRAQLADGRPLEGIKFRLIPRGIGLEFQKGAKGGGVFVDPADDDSWQHVAETAKDGWAEIGSLRNRQYLLEPVFEADAFIPKPDQGAVVVRPPFRPETVVFVEPVALVEAVKQDEVRAGLVHDESVWWTTKGKAVKWCLSKKRALEEANPDTYVSVRLPREGAYDGSPVALSLCTAKHGWVETQVAFRPLSSFKRPREHEAAVSVAPGSLMVIVQAPNGIPIEGAYGFRLTRRDATSSSGDYRLVSSKVMEIAPGDYTLRSPMRWPSRKISEPVVIKSGRKSRMVIKLDDAIVPHEVRVLCPGGTLSVSGSFLFTIDGTGSGGMNYGPGLNPTKGLWFWVKEGSRFEYTVRAFGFPALEGAFLGSKVGAPAASRLIEVRLGK